MKQNLPFDDFVKDRFSNFEPEVPSRIWDNIVAEKRRKPKGFWAGLSDGAKLLLLSGMVVIVSVSGYLIFFNNTLDNNTIEKNKTESSSTPDKDPALKSTGQADTKTNTNTETTTNTDNKPTSPADNEQLNTADQQNQIADTRINAGKQLNDNAGDLTVNNSRKSGSHALGNDKRNPYSNIITPVDAVDLNGGNDVANVIQSDRSKSLRKTFLPEFNNSKKFSFNKNITNTPKLKLPDCPTIEKDAAGNKKYLEVYAGPDYAINKYKTFGDSGSTNYAQKRKDAAVFSSAYSAGVRYTKVFNNGMSVRTGVNFSQINEKFKYVNPSEIRFITVITTRVIIRSPGDTIYINDTLRYQQSGTRVKTTSNRYRTIDIPLVMGYELGNGKLHANINAGAIINLYSWYKGDMLDTTYQPVSITTGKGNSNYQYKTNIGVGFISSISVYYKLNDKWHLLVEPYFRYNLSPISKESLNLQQRYHTAGVRAGIRLDLGQRNK